MSLASLLLAGSSLGWQMYSWRRARRTLLEVRFGRLPIGAPDDDVVWCGIEVVNHSDFAVRVQDVQLVVEFGHDPSEPVIVGLGDERATVPGTVESHDSGFIAGPVPRLGGDADEALVYANVITAVGTVPSEAFQVRSIPHFPAPMRFERLWPDPNPEIHY